MYDLKDEKQAAEYIKNVGIEYRYQCYQEKSPEGNLQKKERNDYCRLRHLRCHLCQLSLVCVCVCVCVSVSVSVSVFVSVTVCVRDSVCMCLSVCL